MPPLPRQNSFDSRAKTRPGTCDRCLADPAQARQCQELARTAQISQMPLPRLPQLDEPRQHRSGHRQLQQQQQETMSCADFLSRLPSGRPVSGVFRELHAYPSREQAIAVAQAHHPALELDAVEAAQALASISKM